MTEIKKHVFCGSPFIESITLRNIIKIRERLFYCCRNLTTITIPDSVTEIGIDTFAHCSALTSVTEIEE